MTAPARTLVLASTSRYRKELLERLSVPFTALAPDCDEDAFKELGLPPVELALTLARKKAESVHARMPDTHVIGSDQLVDLDGEVLGKPSSAQAAEAQLRAMRGRSHRLITALVLLGPDSCEEHVDVHTLTMRALSDDEIARYVARERPLDCAGSYKIEQGGITLVERIEGHDFSAITGLPLIALTSLLRVAGFTIP